MEMSLKVLDRGLQHCSFESGVQLLCSCYTNKTGGQDEVTVEGLTQACLYSAWCMTTWLWVQAEGRHCSLEGHPEASFAALTACVSWLRAVAPCASRPGAFGACSQCQRSAAQPFPGTGCSPCSCVRQVSTQTGKLLAFQGVGLGLPLKCLTMLIQRWGGGAL